ncbi:MAG: LamG-like jellyroll fold domain-containing protein, partial [Bacteroidales bacterium]
MLKAQVPGNGLVFDGDDDYVNVTTTTSDELNPVELLTLECWVYLNEVPSSSHDPHLISRFNCYSLTIAPNGHARAYMHNDEGDWFLQDGTTTITTNKWYHLAATYDGSHMRVFVNGRMEDSTAVWDTMARTTANFRIGARNAYVTNTNTNGIIDEARVWDIPRTESEIQSSMNRTIPGSTPGLVGYWRFDDGSGTNADCETSYNNDGTLMHMSLPAAWITSTASIGEASIFAESTNITETSGCAVDAVFGSGAEGPGSGHSLAVMQVNEFPNSVSGLHPDRANQYWEIWSEDPDFDGDFTADVRFHYDDISGLPTESSIELFRRDNATGTWDPATGYTVVTDDGGSSTGTDGIGYVELTITEGTTEDFSGQFILSWSDAPPVVSNIPDQSVAEGAAFSTIILDNYVNDPDNADSEITWTITGQSNLTVDITDRVATIFLDDPEWNGNSLVTFTATDPEGETDSDDVTFEVTPINDPPVVSDIPDQEIAEGASFATINLDDFVTDVDNDIST